MQNNTVTISDILNDISKDLKNIYSITSDNSDNNDEIQTELGNCHYFTETELNNFLIQKRISDSSHLKLLSLNIANLLSKLKSLKLLLQNISNESNQPNIVTISETHLNESKNYGYSNTELKNLLPGYQFFHKDRKNKKGGGVGIFIENKLADNVSIEKNDYFQEEVFESITTKISDFPTESGSKNLIILTVYRQPGDGNLRRFLDLLQNWLQTYDKRSNEIIITGDFNLDLLRYEIHQSTSEYLDLMISHGLLPAITKPTRIKHQSATLIDHIFLGKTELESGILVSELAGSHGYTDHYPVISFIPTKQKILNKKF